MFKYIVIIFVVTSVTFPVIADEKPVIPRQMNVSYLPSMKLEIWTEKSPEWENRLIKHKGNEVFVSESPDKFYPPTAMSFTTLPFTAGNLEELFQSALEQAMKNYKSKQSVASIKPKPNTYGDLNGLEAKFSGVVAKDVPVDIKFFYGVKGNGRVVVMQVYTFKDKLNLISDYIDRSWDNIKYR